MVDVRRSFTVACPLDRVVAYLRDFSRATEWDPGTRECARTDAPASAPVTVGATWHNVSEFRGRRTELTYRLKVEEPDRLVFVGANRTATSTDDLTFRAEGDATRITYHAHIRFKGLARLADPFLRREFERLGDEITRTMPRAVLRHVGGDTR
ncbi:Polyketide cyclase / dehydrase and lipid transport [Streptomyces sp. ADI96-02]|uniref:SRPBCC family protein n=1 Tax=unclassified Streptomyces TaxID=2593676 RepID=UPI000F54F954|nr:SRPBCC family protein [Streptomyces sp. ADI96-02]RPK61335.1 Polyketide cyclase / dehydrase and lipid transport [Streptomyces sp. ADI96-02]